MTNVKNDKTSYTANLLYRTFEFLLVTWDLHINNIYIHSFVICVIVTRVFTTLRQLHGLQSVFGK